jgi:hypothetical protein
MSPSLLLPTLTQTIEMRSNTCGEKDGEHGRTTTLHDKSPSPHAYHKKAVPPNSPDDLNRKRDTSQAQPSAPKRQKFSKLHVVKPCFNVIYADVLVKLSGAVYLLFGLDGDEQLVLRVQDCVYNKQASGNDANFVPRTVKLSSEQWAELKDAANDIEEAFENGTICDMRIHIGKNTFITAKPDNNIVDIREFFIPAGTVKPEFGYPDQYYDMVIPTRRGVQLSVEGWKRLLSTGVEIIEKVAPPELATTSPCDHRSEDEGTPRDIRRCYHCNPNGCYINFS